MVDEVNKRDVASTISAVGWGAFFVWIGIVMMMEVPHGWALVVIGAITLAGQLARTAYGLAREGFWLIVGALFLLGGVWQLFDVQLQLVPALLIGVGLAVILTRIWPAKRQQKHA
jgi:hypothetical protein